MMVFVVGRWLLGGLVVAVDRFVGGESEFDKLMFLFLWKLLLTLSFKTGRGM